MNSRSWQRQRGAVTLMGALFLIIVIIVLLDAVQRMAASDISDTALQNDAVEALFIAESGLERAAWRYSNGSTCAALVGETDSLGRGSFRILSSTMVGTLCRVRVTGTVMTTSAANTVRRTIEGDFTPGAPPGNAWAVGEKQGGSANIDNWNGTLWNPVAASGVPNKDLFGISCVSDTDCWAVGEDDGGETIIHWDGSSWSRVGPWGDIPNKELYSVDCIASDDCWAVGEDSGGELIIHWDGSSWSRVGPWGDIMNKKLYSIHCVATDDCWATGEKEGDSANLIHWDGSSWSAVAAPSLPNKDLHAIFVLPGGAGGSVELVQWTEVVM